jgi:hypothetical protein
MNDYNEMCLMTMVKLCKQGQIINGSNAKKDCVRVDDDERSESFTSHHRSLLLLLKLLFISCSSKKISSGLRFANKTFGEVICMH